MSGVPPLPPSGLADEMIPLLRARLGLPDVGTSKPVATATPVAPVAPAAPAARRSILAFAEATQAASPEQTSAPPAMIQAVLFSIGDEEYAARIDNVLEILRVAPVTRVPEAPAHVRGVMNLRGRLLPIIEIRTILGLSPLAIDVDSRVIKASIGGRLIGLLVDRVSYVIAIAESTLQAPPRELGERADFVAGVALRDEGIVLLLDLERTLSLPSWRGT